MNQHDFDILLQKYLSGECDPEEERQVVSWSESMLSHSQIDLHTDEQKAVKKRLWKRLKHGTLKKRSVLRITRWFKLGMAAAILLATGYLFYLTDMPLLPASALQTADQDIMPDTSEFKSFKQVKNGLQSRKVVLEDGSIVMLGKESSISYPDHFDGHNRKIRLEGEAFFEVKKDPERPFIVYAGELTTQVLGTSFNVRSYKGAETIEIQVVSGKVSVYENQKKGPQNRNGVILNPNQKITFDKISKKLVPELVEEPAIVTPPDQKSLFVFQEDPLPKVLTAIQNAYNVEIVVETPALDACIFTGDLNELPLHTQLKLICKSVNGTYELRGTTFFIRGEGCTR
jgi:transmembrane sensor